MRREVQRRNTIHLTITKNGIKMVSFFLFMQKGADTMCRTNRVRWQSNFICLKCGESKYSLLNGIARNKVREKGHIKDGYCSQCEERTKQLEVRYCDWLQEISELVPELHNKYYVEINV